MEATVYVDGGSRGNPGQAAAASVAYALDGKVVDRASELLGVTTNNVAEYRALILGLQRAKAVGVTHVHVINDSELVAKQINGLYRVKKADLRPLYDEAKQLFCGFASWDIRSVPRAQNAEADRLVNSALDDRAKS